MVTNYRFKTISVHATSACDMACPFCYANKGGRDKPAKFWYDLVPYIAKLSPQCALGGGEPFLKPKFVREFSMLCMADDLIVNVTTNGHALMKMDDPELARYLRYITMVSISWDEYKIKDEQDIYNYIRLVQRIHNNTHCKVGCNLLVTDKVELVRTVNKLFNGEIRSQRIDRVYALHPKNMPADILKKKDEYLYLTNRYDQFYVDDCSRCIITSGSYTNWGFSCHRGKDMISIRQDGGACSCSFAKPFAFIKQPQEILDIRIPKKEMNFMTCPFVITNK